MTQNQTSQTNRYENSALNQKTLNIIQEAQTELAPKAGNGDIIWMKPDQSLRLRFIVTDKEGNKHEEFNQEVETEYTDKEGRKTYSKRRHFRVVNLSDGGKSQILEIARAHARNILTCMQEMNTCELNVKRIGSGKETNYLAFPLQPEAVGGSY